MFYRKLSHEDNLYPPNGQMTNYSSLEKATFFNTADQNISRHLPVSAIDINKIEDTFAISKKKLFFFYHIMLRTIESCLSKTYSNFDAHTTSTCCHGIAILVQNLILQINHLDLEKFQLEGVQKIDLLTKDTTLDGNCECSWFLPESLLSLARLYVLGYAKKTDPERGILTSKGKLKLIARIGTRFCDQLVDNLQKYFSNLVAFKYESYLHKMPKAMEMHGIPISIWGKYIQYPYLRKDHQGIYYAPALFSMQISLAYLIFSKAIVSIINDVIDETGQSKARIVSIFKGNGFNQMNILTPKETEDFYFNSEKPVIVFGGCTYSENYNEDNISLQMQPWLDQLPSLILACDVWYPQFPKVMVDPEFNSNPITPDEECLNDVIAKHSKIKGVTTYNPSLFCLTHIYTASMNQVLSILNKDDTTTLPIAFIPTAKTTTFCI